MAVNVKVRNIMSEVNEMGIKRTIHAIVLRVCSLNKQMDNRIQINLEKKIHI